MNPLTTQSDEAPDRNPDHNPDLRLNRILTALRETSAPIGLEYRIAQRIAIAQAQPQRPTLAVRCWQLTAGRLAPSHCYALIAVTLAIVTTFALHHKLSPTTDTLSTVSNLRAGGPPHTSVGRSLTYAPAKTRVPEVRLITSPTATTSPTDPDTLALAETLAPSLAAPRMPLTAEEHLLVTATRQGQPIELAELDILRRPAIQAATEARERIAVRNYIHSMLAPLAAAEALNPTSPSPSLSDAPLAFGPPYSR